MLTKEELLAKAKEMAGKIAAKTRQSARSVMATDVLNHLPAAMAAVESTA